MKVEFYRSIDSNKYSVEEHKMGILDKLFSQNKELGNLVKGVVEMVSTEMTTASERMEGRQHTLDNDYQSIVINSPTYSVLESDLCPADHIRIPGNPKPQHGIVMEDGRIMYKKDGRIVLTSLEVFKGDQEIVGVSSDKFYTEDEILQRAKENYEDQSNIEVFRDSEHFAEYCRCGD